MTYQIDPTANGLHINVSTPADKQQALMEEFGKCAYGNCSCPSPQYEKLEAIDVQAGADGVQVELKAKAGEVLDAADIAKCLDHTIKAIGD